MYLGDSVSGIDAVYIWIETDISELISSTGADSRRVSQEIFPFLKGKFIRSITNQIFLHRYLCWAH